MELLQDTELKRKYDKCKYIVKVWEHNFKKKHGRIPSKLDIREADKEVRDAYRTYFNLKLQALDSSFANLDGFSSDEDLQPSNGPKEEDICLQKSQEAVNETVENVNSDKTWGEHLNHKPDKKAAEENATQTDFNTSLSHKLFKGTKVAKRNPRKSLSFTQKKSDVSNKPNFLSQPTTSAAADCEKPATLSQNSSLSFCDSDENILKANNMTKAPEKSIAVPINVLQSLRGKTETTTKRSVDLGWLQRVSQETGFYLNTETEITKSQDIDYDADIIYSSGDEDLFPDSMQSLKKIKLNSPEKVQQKNSSVKSTQSMKNSPEKVVANIFVVKESQKSTSSADANTADVKNDMQEQTQSKQTNSEETRQKINIPKPQKTKNKNLSKPISTKLPTPVDSTRRSLRSRKPIVQMVDDDDDDDNEDPFHSENDTDDPDFCETREEKSETLEDVVVAKKKQTATKKPEQSKPEKENDTEIHSYELEYSVKPRVVTAPRIRSVKELLKATKNNRYKEQKIQDESLKDKRQQLKEKLEKKIESGTLNENFVTINLKKKVFVRGRKPMTSSRYKKQQWKKLMKAKSLAGPDMDMGGCDGGVLTCFNCGQTGHFARQCTKTKGDALLPLTVEDDSPYPTLEEASQMARDSVLAVRKPKSVLNTDAQIVDSNDEEVDNKEDSIFDDNDDEELLAETLKLEEALKLNVMEYVDPNKSVQPVYGLNEDGRIKDTPQEVYDVLRKFGHTTFRQGQEQAVMRILSGKSTLVTLCTGSGKSLCYQLPAYLYSQRQSCITLVISPLVSLMEDQVVGIPSFLKAACYHTNQTKAHREKVMDLIASGDLNVLLISPEAVVAGEKATGFGSIFRKLPPIAFACIDEVHCVSQWSHNFRPSYLMICRVLQERLGVKTILGLTATATKSTCASIIEHINIPDGTSGIIKDIPLPDNLSLTVSKDAQKDNALLGLLMSDRLKECRSIIVYCTRRDECERVAGFLRTSLKYEKAMQTEQKKRKRIDVQAEPYHAGMSASKRKTIQRAFMSGELRIVVATVAFGMGINKSDIRGVIHYNMPKNFESYVQEIGRAGRDGLPAHCHLFLDPRGKDLNELRRHIHANSIDRHVIRKLLQKVFVPCSCEKICPKHEVAFSIENTVRALDIPEENISTLLCYLELHKNKYIEVLSPAYVMCKVVSYGGSNEIKKAAKDCPPLAMALVMYKDTMDKDGNVIEFPVVETAATMGWDSGICKHKLKNLEWTSVNNQPKRSLLNVQFSNLGFRILAPGNLSSAQLDEALDSLYDHVVTQEKTALKQLQALHIAVTTAAESSYKNCTDSNEQLKVNIREYFESEDPLVDLSLTDNVSVNEEKIASDVRNLIYMYKDNVFTGRAVARIFHGIQSPNYPAVIWGRCRFWRIHIDTDFHSICKIATKEILKLR